MLLIRNKWVREIAGVLETANVLMLKLLVRNPTSARSFPGLVFREYMRLAKKDKWLSKSIFDLYPEASGARLVLEHVHDEVIATPIDELAYLAYVTHALKPATIFEIGTFRGRTALNFALNSPAGCRILTLDLPPAEKPKALATPEAYGADRRVIEMSVPERHYVGKDVAHKITQIYGNSLTFDFSPYRGAVDIVFVDAAHHYAAAKSDSENAIAMLRPGGVALWHDFANYGDYNDVTRAVLDTVPAHEVVQLENTQLALYRKPD